MNNINKIYFVVVAEKQRRKKVTKVKNYIRVGKQIIIF